MLFQCLMNIFCLLGLASEAPCSWLAATSWHDHVENKSVHWNARVIFQMQILKIYEYFGKSQIGMYE